MLYYFNKLDTEKLKTKPSYRSKTKDHWPHLNTWHGQNVKKLYFSRFFFLFLFFPYSHFPLFSLNTLFTFFDTQGVVHDIDVALTDSSSLLNTITEKKQNNEYSQGFSKCLWRHIFFSLYRFDHRAVQVS